MFHDQDTEVEEALLSPEWRKLSPDTLTSASDLAYLPLFRRMEIYVTLQSSSNAYAR